MNHHPISLMSLTNEDPLDPNNLKGIHSIESILGIKNFEHHSQTHLLPSTQYYSHKSSSKKRALTEHYSDRK